MTPIRIYTDEHIPAAVIEGLRQLGIDVLSVPDAGLLGADDWVHLERAVADQRVILTQDTDFLRLCREGGEHPGVIFVPRQMEIGEMIRGVELVHGAVDVSEMRGHIEYL